MTQAPSHLSIHDRFGPQSLDDLCILTEQNCRTRAVSSLATQIFQDIQDNRLGMGHYGVKTLCATSAFVATFTLPIAGAAGALWYTYGEVSWPVMIGALLAGTVGNSVVSNLTGVNVRKVILGSAIVGLGYASKIVSEQSIGWAKTREEESQRFIAKRQEALVQELQRVYDRVASHLLEDLESAKNDPERRLEITQAAEKAIENLPLVVKAFHEMGLRSSESEEIILKLRTALSRVIKNTVFLDPNPNKAGDNLDLLLIMPEEELYRISLPSEASDLLQLAESERPTWMDHVRRYGETFACSAAAAVGSVGAAILGTAIGDAAVQSSFNSTAELLNHIDLVSAMTPLTLGIGGATALGFAGAVVAQPLLKRIGQEFEGRRQYADDLHEEVVRRCALAYQQMAVELTHRGSNPFYASEVKSYADEVLSKAQGLYSELREAGLSEEEAVDVLEPLVAAALQVSRDHVELIAGPA